VKKLDFNFASRRQQLENYDYSAVENERMTESDIRMYIEARNKARRELNFGEADNIRNYLKSKGITLIDEKGGRGRGVEVTTWRYCN
jgi:cysteinyl-tRNA synthetase